MTKTTYFKTNTPKAFAQFFSEVNSEQLLTLQESYEKSHGPSGETIDVIFFKEIPGNCSQQLEKDTRFAGIKDYQFSDRAVSKHYVQRQLLVTVVL